MYVRVYMYACMCCVCITYLSIYVTIYSTVDILETVGLRDSTTSDNVIHFLTRPLSSLTNGSEWEGLDSNTTRDYSFFAAFNATTYTGTVIAINTDTQNEFSVQLNSSLASSGMLRTLTIKLPGLASLLIAVPAHEDSAEFLQLGISLEGKLLSVVQNCTAVAAIWLTERPDPLVISDDSVVEIFDPPTAVSILAL